MARYIQYRDSEGMEGLDVVLHQDNQGFHIQHQTHKYVPNFYQTWRKPERILISEDPVSISFTDRKQANDYVNNLIKPYGPYTTKHNVVVRKPNPATGRLKKQVETHIVKHENPTYKQTMNWDVAEFKLSVHKSQRPKPQLKVPETGGEMKKLF